MCTVSLLYLAMLEKEIDLQKNTHFQIRFLLKKIKSLKPEVISIYTYCIE